jgi:hypothetical protein
MPKGPQGQKRPADVISNAVHVMRITNENTTLYMTNDDAKLGKIAKAKPKTPSRK